VSSTRLVRVGLFGLSSMNFSAGNLIAGLVFSGIGFVAFSYGKKQDRTQAMVLGAALMVYPYFTPSAMITCIVGLGLTGLLYLFHE